jgi:hypothetical protein
MKTHRWRYALLSGLCLISAFIVLLSRPVAAQWPFPPATTPDAQRNALNAVRAQVNWLHNATRTASSYGAQGYGNVWQAFQDMRQTYNAFKQTLTQQQAAYGANNFAELDAGLDIIQEAFTNYQDDVAAGQSVGMALAEMCRVLRQASSLWLQELNKTCSRLRVG